MYMVYWMQGYETDSLAPALEYDPQSQLFQQDQMTEALKFCESLRRRVREGARIRFITFVCEHPDQVGEAGVDSIVDGKTPQGLTYDWKKRRV